MLIILFMVAWLEKIVWFYDNNTVNSVNRKVTPVHSVSANFDTLLKERLKDSDWEAWNKYINILLDEWEKVSVKNNLWPAVYVDIPNLENKVKDNIDNILLNKVDNQSYNSSSNTINPYDAYIKPTEDIIEWDLYA